MNHPTHKSLKAAYSFYNVHTQTPLLDLMSDALVLAKMVRADQAVLGDSEWGLCSSSKHSSGGSCPEGKRLQASLVSSSQARPQPFSATNSSLEEGQESLHSLVGS